MTAARDVRPELAAVRSQYDAGMLSPAVTYGLIRDARELIESLADRAEKLERERDEARAMLSSGRSFQERLERANTALKTYQGAFCSDCQPEVHALTEGECIMCNEHTFAKQRDRAEAACTVLVESLAHIGEAFDGRRLGGSVVDTLAQALWKYRGEAYMQRADVRQGFAAWDEARREKERGSRGR